MKKNINKISTLIFFVFFVFSNNCQSQTVSLRLGDATNGCGGNGICDLKAALINNYAQAILVSQTNVVPTGETAASARRKRTTDKIRLKIKRRGLADSDKVKFRENKKNYKNKTSWSLATTSFRHHKRVWRVSSMTINPGSYKVRRKWLGLGRYKMTIRGVTFVQ